MANIKFIGLCLLSRKEQRGLKVSLTSPKVVIQGGNGFGKSAVVKSLYDTLGATPQRVDKRWKDAEVSSALVLEIDGKRFTAVKALGRLAFFDDGKKLLFQGTRLVKDWAPRLAEFLNFQLVMNERDGTVIPPPPAYIFAPFYVDQDKSWNKAWDSFSDFYLPDSTRTLAEYHAGIKPDAYYSAKAGIATDKLQLAELHAGIHALRDAIEQFKSTANEAEPVYDMQVFQAEVVELVAESNRLLDLQSAYRRKISDLHEEAHLLRAERGLLQSAISEMKGEFEVAARLPEEVECPTCGHAYANGLAQRFMLIEDEGVLREAVGDVGRKLGIVEAQEWEQQAQLISISEAIGNIEHILSARKAAISLEDIVLAAGRTEASKALRATLGERAAEADEVSARIEENQRTMASLTSTRRTREINEYYRTKLAEFARLLDVTLDGSDKQDIRSIRAARGSEGPRGLLAYYFAFLHTKAQFGRGVMAPIVIDAPNQQGQDAEHLPQMLEFILTQAPAECQVIVAVEDATGASIGTAKLSTYGERKRQVLKDEEFEWAKQFMEPYLVEMENAINAE